MFAAEMVVLMLICIAKNDGKQTAGRLWYIFIHFYLPGSDILKNVNNSVLCCKFNKLLNMYETGMH